MFGISGSLDVEVDSVGEPTDQSAFYTAEVGDSSVVDKCVSAELEWVAVLRGYVGLGLFIGINACARRSHVSEKHR